MPIQGILEEDVDESVGIVMVLREDPKSMNAKETEKWMRALERNMCPIDYDREYIRSKN